MCAGLAGAGHATALEALRARVERRAKHEFYELARSRKALEMTDTELKLIANAAIMGDSSQPVNGYKTPAAKGTPKAL